MLRLVARSIRHPRITMVVSLVLALLLGLGTLRLHITSDHSVSFGSGSDAESDAAQLAEWFGGDDNLYVCITAVDGDMLTPRSLEMVRHLTAIYDALPEARAVESITNYPRVRISLGGLTMHPAVGTSYGGGLSDTVREALLADPLVSRWLLSDDGRSAGISVRFGRDMIHDHAQLATWAYRVADSTMAANPGYHVATTGSVAIDAAFSTASTRDAVRLVPAMYVVVAVLMLVFVPCLRAIGCALALFALASVATLGAMGFAGIPISPPSSVVPLIVLVLGVASTIHLLVALFHDMRQGRSQREAVLSAYRRKLPALVAANATSVAGFLCLNLGSVPAFRDLGNGAAVGVVLSMVLTVTLLPAVLSMTALRPVRTRWSGTELLGAPLGRLVMRHPRALGGGLVVVAILLSSGVVRARFDDVFEDYFGQQYRFRRDLDVVQERMAGLDYLSCAVAAPDSAGLADSAYLQCLDSLSRWCGTLPEVVQVISLPAVLRKVGADLRGYRDTGLPPTGIRRAVLARATRDGGDELVGSLVNPDEGVARIVARLRKLPASELRSLAVRIRVQAGVVCGDTVQVVVGSEPLAFAHLADRNARSMLWSVTASLLMVTLALGAIGRSLRCALVSLVPNVLPVLMAFGAWGLIVGRAGMGLSVVVPVALGVIVDDTVHFLSVYLRGRRARHLSPTDAIHYAYRHVSDAAVFTTLVLAAGFGVLALSGFQPTAHMGMLIAAILVFALANDLVLLPVLLRAVRL